MLAQEAASQAAPAAPMPPGPASVVPSPAPPSPTPAAAVVALNPGAGIHERRTTWDANVEGAFGATLATPARASGFGRARLGVLHIRDSLYLSAGFTFEASDRIPATFGVQGEALHLETGFWFQTGALLDVRPRPGFMASVGWSVLGFEFQYRDYETLGPTAAVYGKLRIPVRIIALALER